MARKASTALVGTTARVPGAAIVVSTLAGGGRLYRRTFDDALNLCGRLPLLAPFAPPWQRPQIASTRRAYLRGARRCRRRRRAARFSLNVRAAPPKRIEHAIAALSPYLRPYRNVSEVHDLHEVHTCSMSPL